MQKSPYFVIDKCDVELKVCFWSKLANAFCSRKVASSLLRIPFDFAVRMGKRAMFCF